MLEFCAWRMDCSGCEASLKRAVSEIEGVDHVEADRFSCVVTIRLEEGAKADDVKAKIEPALSKTSKKFRVVEP